MTMHYTEILQEADVEIGMAKVGKAWQNGYTERLLRTIKEGEIDPSDYQGYTDAIHQLSRFLGEVYVHRQIHASWGYVSPAELKSQWLRSASH